MNGDEENGSAALARMKASKHFPAIEALVAHLRRRGPETSPAAELAYAVNRPKRQIYGLVKLARRFLAMTTGESIPNLREVGYRITNQPRALIFESIKSGDRADGHLRQERSYFRRVHADLLTSEDDRDLYVAQMARMRIAEARLALSQDMAPVMKRLASNSALSSVARSDASTPWKALGLDDPDDTDGNN